MTGKGTVKIMFEGIYFALTNVYYLPDLKSNILSLGQLQEKIIIKKICAKKVYHRDRGLIMKLYMKCNRTFMITGEAVKERLLYLRSVLKQKGQN